MYINVYIKYFTSVTCYNICAYENSLDLYTFNSRRARAKTLLSNVTLSLEKFDGVLFFFLKLPHPTQVFINVLKVQRVRDLNVDFNKLE